MKKEDRTREGRDSSYAREKIWLPIFSGEAEFLLADWK